ncbi:SRPBCC family protein [Nitriliruptor alkaliphilus]|uniref:SRPBCC family protein n=1 Tax=Nitriliruptor alkaliphilus TaxID=427918 RepID=UPI000698D99A|nr:SRPBCC family protein [Nitriliruptor alkaliphilus]
MARYRFVTEMHLGAPIDAVYGAIADPDGWVGDWADAVTVRRDAPGDRDGLGARFTATVRAPAGYELSATIETVETKRPTRLRMRSSGELEGGGVWQLRPRADGTDVRFDWDVTTTATWMNRLTPVARALFEWSHGVVVRNATDAAAAHLGTEVLWFRSRPDRQGRGRRAAAVAIVVAVVLATYGARCSRSVRSSRHPS